MSEKAEGRDQKSEVGSRNPEPIRRSNEQAAALGHPSYVWRAGQVRRFDMIRQWGKLEGADVLVDGAGVGMYSRHLSAAGAHVVSLDIVEEDIMQAAQVVNGCLVGAAERLPFPSASFDTILSHEVLEHVDDDAKALTEVARVLRPGGRLLLFVPNRLYPYETHGHYWKGEYHFGNTPLINYLPDRWRNRLAPHVRAYRKSDLRRLLDPLPLHILHFSQIYPGYDNIIYRFPRLGRLVRGATYTLENTSLRTFGLSHFLVAERVQSND
ncbi:MAG: class I SAM-dependent methyltransferase [Caldilineales bacterium]|nr:class I SAM-dependent methyltransferase [Caldilineales bacterium]